MKWKSKLAANRAQCFCQALAAESEGRKSPIWWSSIDSVARRLKMPYDETVKLADECAQAGYVTHDQSQSIKAERRGAELPHSVTLNEAGRRLARDAKG